MRELHRPAEKRADTIIHVLGVTAGAMAVAAMLIAATAWLPVASTMCLAVYGATLLAMFGFSAAYHMTPPSRPAKSLLQRLDHAAIFVKIAGTYTPLTALKIGGAGGLSLLTLVWSIALAGAAGKLLLASTWDRFAIPLYLGLGWIGVVMFGPLADAVAPLVLVLLAIGGALYTIGVVFHVLERIPYHRAIWHGFVLAATACHFGAITAAVFT